MVHRFLDVGKTLPVEGNGKNNGDQERNNQRPDTAHCTQGGQEWLVFQVVITRRLRRVDELREHEVEDEYQNDGHQGNGQRWQVAVIKGFERLLRVITIELALRIGLLGAMGQPPDAQRKHHGTADGAENRRGVDGCLEERHRNGVLDLRRAGQCRHGEGESTEGDGAGNQELRRAGFLEQVRGNRIHGKGDDEQRNPAVGQNRTGEHHGEDRPLLAEFIGNGVGNRLGTTGIVHDLAENSTEQEDREEHLEIVRHVRHVHMRKRRQQGHI